jgi:hypothetical protein
MRDKVKSAEYSLRKVTIYNEVHRRFSLGYPKKRPVSKHRNTAGIKVEVAGVTHIQINITLWCYDSEG